ncbi:MAG: hypothetical protein HZB29_04005 [Nitrospinae bacterium]|nr:hypothetical protein [Nitrospinota bacterium]
MKRALFLFLSIVALGALYGGTASATAIIPDGNNSLGDIICGFHSEPKSAPAQSGAALDGALSGELGAGLASLQHGQMAAKCHTGKNAAFHASSGCCLKNCGGLAAAAGHDMTDSHFLAEAEALPKTPGHAGIFAQCQIVNKGRLDGPNPRPPSI